MRQVMTLWGLVRRRFPKRYFFRKRVATPSERMSAISDHQGVGQQDPAERLASALHRIAVAIERREAAVARPAVNPVALPAMASSLDGLIARLRAVLDERPTDVAESS